MLIYKTMLILLPMIFSLYDGPFFIVWYFVIEFWCIKNYMLILVLLHYMGILSLFILILLFHCMMCLHDNTLSYNGSKVVKLLILAINYSQVFPFIHQYHYMAVGINHILNSVHCRIKAYRLLTKCICIHSI